jgi:hypothetical protein
VIAEVTDRLQEWDFSTPTGIPEGYDASDVDGTLSAPSSEEIAASVATTIYSVWRGQFIENTVDAPLDAIGLPKPDGSHALSALRNLLDNFDANGGVGDSGLNFFGVPGVADASDRRDIIILQSLADSLQLLAGPEFEPAFGGSTELNDYRWGKLHRTVFEHPLGEPCSNIPSANRLAFRPPSACSRRRCPVWTEFPSTVALIPWTKPFTMHAPRATTSSPSNWGRQDALWSSWVHPVKCAPFPACPAGRVAFPLAPFTSTCYQAG